MHDDADIQRLFAEIRVEWNKAERAIKTAEIVSHDAIVPAIYELRYAGRRFVDAFEAIETGNRADAIRYLDDARLNCFRARHDAIDAAISKMALDIEALLKKAGGKTVLKYYPPLDDLKRRVMDAQMHIAESREKRDNRDAVYAAIESADLPSLAPMYQALMSHRKTLKHRVAVGRQVTFFTVLAAVLIIIGHLADMLGILSFVLGLLGFG